MGALISCSCPKAENSPDLNTRTVIADFWRSISFSLAGVASAAHNISGAARAAANNQPLPIRVVICHPKIYGLGGRRAPVPRLDRILSTEMRIRARSAEKSPQAGPFAAVQPSGEKPTRGRLSGR